MNKNKENLDLFNKSSNADAQLIINRAKIEVQTVEAVQMNLDSIPLFTCDVDDNLENSDCFCITHDIHDKQKNDKKAT